MLSNNTPGSAARASRKSRKTGGDDIIKELEDYVKCKKSSANKFLDDISEYDPQPDQYKPNKDNKPMPNNIINTSGLIKNEENQSNIDVYDYCDKMMKDLNGYDKQMNNHKNQ